MVSGSERGGMLRLSIRDRRMAIAMLKKDALKEDGLEKEWRRELQVMLILGLKAEIELLGERKGGIEAWVERRLVTEIEEIGKTRRMKGIKLT